MGTAAYMSPEQIRGEKVDVRTDLFSLGLVLYEMATGRQAFYGTTTAAVHDAILNQSPAPSIALNPSLPPKLDEIINKAIVKDRHLRFHSAGDLDAKGIYLGSVSPQGMAVLYVDLKGDARVLWQYKGAGGGTCGIPSPDGRHLLIPTAVRNSNVWMIENF